MARFADPSNGPAPPRLKPSGQTASKRKGRKQRSTAPETRLSHPPPPLGGVRIVRHREIGEPGRDDAKRCRRPPRTSGDFFRSAESSRTDGAQARTPEWRCPSGRRESQRPPRVRTAGVSLE